ncbi:hypothetical protein GWK91_10735 [Virgibacillus sp. MSP4-1]|uniref:YdeI/OmpD-associated family protein n=1 Tax=Virgibacillus sp. MSP4-1 TaxID=2700081 RepID=UPI0003A36B47|nr:DUF1801 domain-containing protein [Virgibacillus sp. MSP4-1]QHS23399.1 hypothetical protein GWK91_10735 [Virgibacillus sp. MSP4-1]
MTNAKTNPKVDDFLSQAPNWQQEFEELRRIILDCGLTEELKWNLPCYTFQKNNIVIIQGFKNYCALMFFKGALLKDPEAILTSPGEHSQAQRQIRFTDVQEIVTKESALKAYIHEAIEVQKAGLEVKKTTEFTIPDELQVKFDESPDFKKAFEALTPGRQRAYILYFSKAKQSKTRISRIEKYTEHIFNGKGLND